MESVPCLFNELKRNQEVNIAYYMSRGTDTGKKTSANDATIWQKRAKGAISFPDDSVQSLCK